MVPSRQRRVNAIFCCDRRMHSHHQGNTALGANHLVGRRLGLLGAAATGAHCAHARARARVAMLTRRRQLACHIAFLARATEGPGSEGF